MELRRHLGAAAEHAGDAGLLQRDALAQRFEQLRRGEQALDGVVRLEERQRLVDDVALVELHHLHLAHLDQLDHPARIEIDHEADAAAMLREMFDGEPQPARAARADHQPVSALRKLVVRQRLAEQLVVDAEVVDVDARLRHAGAAAGLERVDRLVLVGARHPAPHRAAAQPLVLERAELVEVLVALESPCADPSRPSRPIAARTDSRFQD